MAPGPGSRLVASARLRTVVTFPMARARVARESTTESACSDPTVQQHTCATCHVPVDRISPRCGKYSRSNTRADRAIGVAEGEIRGWFCVEMPRSDSVGAPIKNSRRSRPVSRSNERLIPAVPSANTHDFPGAALDLGNLNKRIDGNSAFIAPLKVLRAERLLRHGGRDALQHCTRAADSMAAWGPRRIHGGNTRARTPPRRPDALVVGSGPSSRGTAWNRFTLPRVSRAHERPPDPMARCRQQPRMRSSLRSPIARRKQGLRCNIELDGAGQGRRVPESGQ
jgi:hypothetical protein